MRKADIEQLSVDGLCAVYDGSCLDGSLVLIDDMAALPLPTTPRRMHGVLLMLCLEGEAHYVVNTVPYHVQRNDCVVVHDGMVLSDCHMLPGFSALGVMLTTHFLSMVIKEIHKATTLFLFTRQHPVFAMTADEVRAVRQYFAALKLKADDHDHHFRADVVRLLLSTMIYDLSNAVCRYRQIDGRSQTRAEDIFTQFINLVETHYRRERRVDWYAGELCLTPKYLSETVRRVSGRSPNKWIDHYVLLEMRVLLRETTMSLKEIARHLGYTTQSALGKFFKENVGMSPTNYRRSD